MNSTPVRDHGAKTMRDDAQHVACASLKKVDLFSTLPNSKFLHDLAGAARFREMNCWWRRVPLPIASTS